MKKLGSPSRVVCFALTFAACSSTESPGGSGPTNTGGVLGSASGGAPSAGGVTGTTGGTSTVPPANGGNSGVSPSGGAVATNGGSGGAGALRFLLWNLPSGAQDAGCEISALFFQA